MPSIYDELIDLLLAGCVTAAVGRLRDGTDIGAADAERWLEEFRLNVVGPIAGGVRTRSAPVVIGIPGVMGGQPCIGGTRVPVKTIALYLLAGSTEAEIHADYPTLPPGSVDAVINWARDNPTSAVASAWTSPLPPGLSVGQVVYDTHELPDGSRVTFRSVINGSYAVGDGWHYDLHGVDDGNPALDGQPLGPSCRIGEFGER